MATSPTADAVLPTIPATVELAFDGRVAVDLSTGIEIYAPDGERVEDGPATVSDAGRRVVVGLDDGGRGTYTVAWRVVSEDGHVLEGSFVFHVGEPGGVGADLGGRERPGLRVGSWAGRWLSFVGMVLAGGVAFAWWAVSGATAADRPLRRLAGLGVVALLVGAVLRLVLQVAEASGRSPTGALALVDDAVRTTRAGRLDGVRVLAAIVGVLGVVTWRDAEAKLLLGSAAVVTALSNAASGHAWSAPRHTLVVLLDAVHQCGAVAWIGGLAATLVAARAVATATEDLEGGALLRRYSSRALVAAPVVVLTGLASALAQLGGPSGFDSRYAVVVAVKAVAVGVVLALAWVNRGLIRTQVARVVRAPSIPAEVAFALVVVVGLTATLVATVPGREAEAAGTAPGALGEAPEPGPRVSTFADGDGSVVTTVTPLAPGRHLVELQLLDPVGTPRPTDGATLSVARADLPPRAVALLPAGTGVFRADDVSLPQPGAWLFTLTTIARGLTTARTFEVQVP